MIQKIPATVGRRAVVAAAALMLSAAPVHGQVLEAGGPRTIRVTGVGEVQAKPDQAQINLGVETRGETARAAGEANARTMERVIRALVSAGVARDRIETRNYSLFPEYGPMNPERVDSVPRIVAYRASNVVSVRTTELERTGRLIDTALGAGANRLESVEFSLRNADAAQAQATRRAVERANAAAQNIAGALGVRLGAVLDASTSAEMMRPYPVAYRRQSFDVAAAEMAAPPTPISPQEQTITSSVSLVYEIQGTR